VTRRYSWKERVAWPALWLAGLIGPAIKRLQDAIDRWIDR